jgi:BASS family bile acid:Na+ symporter
MFGMGLTLKPDDFKVVFSRPKDVLFGCVAQFTIIRFWRFCSPRCFGPAPGGAGDRRHSGRKLPGRHFLKL